MQLDLKNGDKTIYREVVKWFLGFFENLFFEKANLKKIVLKNAINSDIWGFSAHSAPRNKI